MLDHVVRYLRGYGASFRLSSAPSPELLPDVGEPRPPGSLVVETRLLSVGGSVAIACMPRGATLSWPEISRELGAVVVEAGPADLPAPFSGASGHFPPLGGVMQATTVVDVEVMRASSLVFTAFSPFDLFEIPIDDFARIEHPRIAAFAIGGELPQAEEGEGEVRKAG
jgi:prolyl-tRNA editing enzyme YbaK/EbsC (Cys-tRNA(Pro) deacylase)